VQAAPEAPKAQIIDLLEALKRSVAQVGEGKPSLKKAEKPASVEKAEKATKKSKSA
jgi:non-homologous end joining protein Ku